MRGFGSLTLGSEVESLLLKNICLVLEPIYRIVETVASIHLNTLFNVSRVLIESKGIN